MKILLLIFVAGLGLATAGPLSSHSFDLSYYDEDGFLDELKIYAEDDTKTELGETLRTYFHDILEKLRDVIDNGKTFRNELVEKAKEIRQKLKEMGLDIKAESKELLKKLKEKAKDYWNKVLDKIHLNSPEDFEIYYGEDNDMKTELGEKLRKHFEEIMEKIRDIIDNGKAYKEDLAQKAKEIRDELKAMGMDISKHAKALINKLKSKAKDYWKKFLDKLHPNKESSPEDFEILSPAIIDVEVRSELEETLRGYFNQILEKMKDIIENGKTFREDLVERAKEIRQKLKEMGSDIGAEAKEALKNLKEKAKDYWNKILDKIHMNSDPEDFEIYFIDHNDMQTELGKKLSKHLDEILEKIRDIVENERAYREDLAQKAREIRDELKAMGFEISNHAKALISRLKTKAKDLWKKFLDKFHPSKDSPEDFEIYYGDDNDMKTELGEKLRKHFEEIMEKIRDIIENGKAYKEDLAQKAKEIRDELKALGMDISNHAKALINKLKNKAKDYWKKFLDKLHPNKESSPEDFEILFNKENDDDNIITVTVTGGLAHNLRENFKKLLEKLHDVIVNGKTFREDLTEKAKKIHQKLKELGEDIGDDAKELLQKIKENSKDYWNKILEKLKLHGDPDEIGIYYGEDNEIKTELGQKLKAHFDEIVEKLKDIIENGKAYKDDLVIKAKEIRDKLRELGMDIGKHAKEVLSRLKSKAKDYWKKILDKLHPE